MRVHRTIDISGAAHIGERDLYGSLGLTALGFYLSGRLTGSSYDKNLDTVAAFAARRTYLAGLGGTIQGFPRESGNARLEYDGWEPVNPYVSYTKTSFELDQPDSEGITYGVYLTWKKVTFNLFYEVYNSGAGSGEPILYLTSIEGTYRF